MNEQVGEILELLKSDDLESIKLGASLAKDLEKSSWNEALNTQIDSILNLKSITICGLFDLITLIIQIEHHYNRIIWYPE